MAGGGGDRERAICGKAAVETPGEEDGLAGRVVVREAARAEGGHMKRVAVRRKNSLAG